jgi:hypothetical protein
MWANLFAIMSLFAFASERFEAATWVHATKLKSRFLTLEKNKACEMFVAIEIKDNRKFNV